MNINKIFNYLYETNIFYFFVLILVRTLLDKYIVISGHIKITEYQIMINNIVYYSNLILLLILLLQWTSDNTVKLTIKKIFNRFIIIIISPLIYLVIIKFDLFRIGLTEIDFIRCLEIIFFILVIYPLVGILRITLCFFVITINISIAHFFSYQIQTYLYAVFIFIYCIGILYKYDKRAFYILFKDIRIYRTLHYIFMIIFGLITLSMSMPVTITPVLILKFLLLCISLFCAIYFSMITNNMSDIEIDKISNPCRPLIKSELTMNKYIYLGIILLILSFFFAAMISFIIFYLVLAYTGVYFIYSMPPLRLKRIPVFSKVCISFNSLLMALAGYALININIVGFPKEYILFFILIFTLPVNFIDIKDYEGDKKNNIFTLPVLWGLKKSKIAIGLFFIMAYSIVSFLFKPAFIGGIIQYYLINKKKYNEPLVFMVYLFGLLILFVYLFITHNNGVDFNF